MFNITCNNRAVWRDWAWGASGSAGSVSSASGSGLSASGFGLSSSGSDSSTSGPGATWSQAGEIVRTAGPCDGGYVKQERDQGPNLVNFDQEKMARSRTRTNDTVPAESQDDRYYRLIVDALRVCWDYLFQVVRPGGAVYYIVGNSKFYDVMLPVEAIFAALFEAAGFSEVSAKIVRKLTSKKELFEFLVSARKPNR